MSSRLFMLIRVRDNDSDSIHNRHFKSSFCSCYSHSAVQCVAYKYLNQLTANSDDFFRFDC